MNIVCVIISAIFIALTIEAISAQSSAVCAPANNSSTNSTSQNTTNEGAPPPSNSTTNPAVAAQNITCLLTAYEAWSHQYLCGEQFYTFNLSNLQPGTNRSIYRISHPRPDVPNCNCYEGGVDPSPPNANSTFNIDRCLLIVLGLYFQKDYCVDYWLFDPSALGCYGIQVVNAIYTEQTTCNPAVPLSDYTRGCVPNPPSPSK